MLKPTLVTRIGGPMIFDAHQHTLCLECPIPASSVNSSTMSISFKLSKYNIK